MKVVILTASLGTDAGGLFFTITSLSKALRHNGVDVTVVGFDDTLTHIDRKEYGEVTIKPYTRVKIPLLNTLGYSRDIDSILQEIGPDVIHLQGLWMYHSHAALKYRKANPETVLIIEPHGMLDPWAVNNSRWKKRIVGLWYENKNLHSADRIHVLCSSEKDSVIRYGLKNPISIVPNGINTPEWTNRCFNSDTLKLLFIGRLHPKKGLINLINAFGIIKHSHPKIYHNLSLDIAGWNQMNHKEYLEARIRELELDKVHILGPVFGEEKKKILDGHDVFILPSLSEGLPMSILEAWAAGLPVLMTEACNLPEGFVNNAAIRIEADSNKIADSIVQYYSLTSDEKCRMAYNAYNLVLNSFNWDAIAKQTIQMYSDTLR